jgi:hypothetical protein
MKKALPWNINCLWKLGKNPDGDGEYVSWNKEKVYKRLMDMTVNDWCSMVESERQEASEIINNFFRIIVGDTYDPMKYEQVDDVAAKCKQLANVTKNIMIKAELIKGLYDLYFTYNRFYCGRIFYEFINSIKDDYEGKVLAETLTLFSSSIIKDNRIDWSKVNPTFRKVMWEYKEAV